MKNLRKNIILKNAFKAKLKKQNKISRFILNKGSMKQIFS